MLNGASVLITGGTGSLGQGFVRLVLERYPAIRRLVIYSRDEMTQYEMSQRWPLSRYPMLRYFIGDVRDERRLTRAMEGIDMVVHAAALKQIPAAEYNPIECIRTNVLGAENVINAALDAGVQRVVALSTDKAAAPINLYGATKLCSDKLFVAANNIRGSRSVVFSVVRYGNVMGSRGSVVPLFLERRQTGVLPITHPDMTRFNILVHEGVELIIYALEQAWGGEIFVPKIPSFRLLDLAQAVAPDARLEIIGIRPGEKLHEEMITASDALNTIETERYYMILPAAPRWDAAEYRRTFSAQPVEAGFTYSSATNSQWLTVDDLRRLIAAHVDPAGAAVPAPAAVHA
ncbi:MAG: UDP-N-acetylglucosamine 4,6-dehydratase (inverting) [Candidatus Andersenbacteria bacterium]|nr:UDP-N-acetylglucosamine 4,6-dehydratase (inverting) [Candidatus Andersenbacteria bacterium]